MKTKILLICFAFCSFLLSAQTVIVNHNGQSINMVPGTTYEYYDSGGANGNYSNNEYSTVSFAAFNQPDMVVEARFEFYDMESSSGSCNDYLYATMAQMYALSPDGDYCGRSIEGRDFRSFPSGSLDFTFQSNSSVVQSGWKAIVKLVPYEEGESCNDATEVYYNTYFQGDNFGYSSDYLTSDYASCYSTNSTFLGNDQVFYYQNNTSTTQTVDITLEPLVDLDLFIFESCQNDNLINCIAYSTNPNSDDETIILSLSPGEDIYMVVDAFNSTITGSFLLYVQPQNVNDVCDCKAPIGYSLVKCDGAELYNTSDGISDQSSEWIKWDATASDAVPTNSIAKTASQSIEFDNLDDNAYLLGDLTAGKYRLAWNMYIEPGSLGYFNIQHAESLNHWAYEVFFQNNGTGELQYGAPASVHDFSYPIGSWFYVMQLIDINNDVVELWINNQFVASWQFSIGTTNGVPNNLPQLGAINFYALGGAHFYVDDICLNNRDFIPVCSDVYDPVCINDLEYGNECYALSAGYTACEWSDGPCADICGDCSNCFTYHFDQNNYLVLDHDPCEIQNPLPTGRSTTSTYQWDFPAAANVQYQNGTNANSVNPICDLDPGTWEICMTYTYFDDGIPSSYYCCVLIVVPVDPCYANEPECTFTSSELGGLQYFFDGGSSTNADEYSWVIENENGNALTIPSPNGSNLTYTFPSTGCYTVCLYVSSACGYAKKCMTICTQSPPLVPHDVDYTVVSNELNFINVPDGADSYYWDVPPGVQFTNGTGSDSQYPTCQLPGAGRYVICLIVKFGNRTVCCCWTIISPPNQDPVHIDIEDNVCSAPNQTVFVPVYAYDFNEISIMSIQFGIDDANVGTFQGVANVHPSLNGLFGVVQSPDVLSVIWNNINSNISLPTGTKMFDLQIQLGSTPNTNTTISVLDAQFTNTTQAVIGYTAAPGSICITQPDYMISGKVKTIQNEGVGQATVNLTGYRNQTRTTGPDGLFTFTIPGGFNYNVQASKDINDANGVQIEDNVLLLRHLAGWAPFVFDEPWQYIAADLNDDGEVNIFDLSYLNNIISGRTSNLDLVQSWFVLPERNYNQLPTNPLGGTINQALSFNPLNSNQANSDFIAIKKADLNLDAMEDNIIGASDRSTNERIIINPSYDPTTNKVTAKIMMENLDKMVGFNLNFNWDTTYLEYVSAEPVAIPTFQDVVTTNTNIGILRTWWSTGSPTGGISTSIPETIFELVFELKETPTSSLIELSQSPNESFILNEALDRIFINAQAGEVTESLVPTQNQYLEELEISPNPVEEVLYLDYGQKSEEVVSVKITSVDGSIMQTFDTAVGDVNVASWANGVYLLNIETVSGNYLTKFVKL